MAEDSGISWTHNTQNFWIGCDKVAPECAKCYIARILQKQGREPWGEVYRTQTWEDPWDWEAECLVNHYAKRVFTCSLSDFFHAKADPWREQAWRIVKRTPHLVWLILTKRPERITKCLPGDWGNGYPNVWLGVSVGTRQTLNKMDTLRRIPAAVRWISAEPLLEDISADINLDGFGWVVVGGESGAGKEYPWDAGADWKAELKNEKGRRTMKYQWAANLRDEVKAAGLPYMFKQVTAPRSGFGYNALDGKGWHEFPPAPNGLEWAPRRAIPDKYKMTPAQIANLKQDGTYPFKSNNCNKVIAEIKRTINKVQSGRMTKTPNRSRLIGKHPELIKGIKLQLPSCKLVATKDNPDYREGTVLFDPKAEAEAKKARERPAKPGAEH